MISEAYRSRAGWAEFLASRFARLRLFALAFRFPAAIVNGLLTCNVVTFFVAIAAKQKNPACRRIGRGTPKPQALPVHPWSEQHGPSRSRLGGAQIFSGRFAGPAVGDDVKADFLPLIEGAHAGAFNRADMNEDVIAAVGGLNEAEALLVVKPLHSSCVHREYPFTDKYT